MPTPAPPPIRTHLAVAAAVDVVLSDPDAADLSFGELARDARVHPATISRHAKSEERTLKSCKFSVERAAFARKKPRTTQKLLRLLCDPENDTLSHTELAARCLVTIGRGNNKRRTTPTRNTVALYRKRLRDKVELLELDWSNPDHRRTAARGMSATFMSARVNRSGTGRSATEFNAADATRMLNRQDARLKKAKARIEQIRHGESYERYLSIARIAYLLLPESVYQRFVDTGVLSSPNGDYELPDRDVTVLEAAVAYHRQQAQGHHERRWTNEGHESACIIGGQRLGLDGHELREFVQVRRESWIAEEVAADPFPRGTRVDDE